MFCFFFLFVGWWAKLLWDIFGKLNFESAKANILTSEKICLPLVLLDSNEHVLAWR